LQVLPFLGREEKMKKIFAVVLALVFVSGVAVPCFAQAVSHKKAEVVLEVVRGKIVSLDVAKKEVVVKEEKSGLDKTFTVSEKAISALKVGDNVKIKIKPGNTAAESVKVINPEAKKK
jgi:hypothetical protein